MIELITHNDLDAVGCVILGKLAYGDNLHYTLCDYSNIAETVAAIMADDSQCEEVHITDISVPYEMAKEINDTKTNYWLHDHHKSAVSLNDFEWCNVQTHIHKYNTDIMTAGTELYYEWLVSRGLLTRTNHLDNFVAAIRDYDTWRWKDMGPNGALSDSLNILAYELSFPKFIYKFYSQLNENKFSLSDTDYIIINGYHKRETDTVNRKEKEMKIVSYRGYNVGLVYADTHVNAVGNDLCTRHPEVDLVMIVNCGKGTASFRTVKDDVDVSVLAKELGGGGHKSAAGAVISPTMAVDIFNYIFK